MWFVFDSKERNILYAKFETEFEARMYARKIDGYAVWNC